MKKAVSMLLVMALTASLAACSGGGNGGSGSSTADAPQSTGEASSTVDLTEFGADIPDFVAPEGVDYTQGDKITITMATGSQTSSATEGAMYPFKKMIETATGGRITVDIHNNASLGTTREIYEQMSQGIIDMVCDGTETGSQFNDIIAIFSLPYLFTSDEQAQKYCRDEQAMQMYYDAFDNAGFRPLTFFLVGWYVITTKNEIPGPGDVGGMKIRCVENDLMLAMMESVNAIPTPMNYGEVYTGMQQGTIDGQYTLFNMTPLGKFYEVQNYSYLINSIAALSTITISDNCWNKLSDTDKQLFEAAAKHCNYFTEYYMANTYYEFIPQMQTENPDFTIVEYDSDEMQIWIGKMRPIHEQYYDRFGKDNIDAIVNYQ